jgi:hypothetical protein
MEDKIEAHLRRKRLIVSWFKLIESVDHEDAQVYLKQDQDDNQLIETYQRIEDRP